MDKNDTLILCCASVRRHLDAAQRKLGTDFPVQELAWENHKEPAVMHETLLRTMAELPESITTGAVLCVQLRRRVGGRDVALPGGAAENG